jgi:hypothetical protein
MAIRRVFEPSRLSSQCLENAYELVVPPAERLIESKAPTVDRMRQIRASHGIMPAMKVRR